MGWGCVHTQGSQEARVVHNLRRQGYEAFCPRYTRASDRSPAPNDYPLWPCYAFVRVDQGTRWGPINGTRGVVRILTNQSRDNPRLLLVPDSFIESMDRMGVLRDEHSLDPGTVVRVRREDSPVYDYVGTVVAMVGTQRVRVLMSMFNRDTVVEFESTSHLEVV